MNPCAIRIASVAPSREAASNSSARRRVAGGLRVRALRRGLPTEDIVRAYGTAMRKSSRAGRIATGRRGTSAARRRMDSRRSIAHAPTVTGCGSMGLVVVMAAPPSKRANHGGRARSAFAKFTICWMLNGTFLPIRKDCI